MKLQVYSIYKKSKSKWIGDIPEKWDEVKLKFCSTINRNTLSEDTDPNYSFNYVDISNVDGDGNILNYEQMNFEDSPSRARRIPAKGDTILSTVRTYLKAIAYLENIQEKTIVSTGFAVIEPKKGVHSKYLFYMLRSEVFVQKVIADSKGVAYPAINPVDLSQITVLLPSSEEQVQIANYLDTLVSRINLIIDKDKKLIDLLREKRTSIINQAVTKGIDPTVQLKHSGIEGIGEIPNNWQIMRLKFLVTKIGSGITPKGGSLVYQDQGIPLIRSQNVHFEGLRLNDVAYISEDIYQSMINSATKKHDVLLNITGASIGRCSVVEDEIIKGNVNQHVCIIRCDSRKLYYRYLNYLLMAKMGQDQILSVETGTSREGLNFEQIGDLRITLPSIEEQIDISKFVYSKTQIIDRIIIKIHQRIQLLDEYKKSLINYVVTGKIDVRKNNGSVQKYSVNVIQ